MTLHALPDVLRALAETMAANDDGDVQVGERYPVVRTGERPQIPAWLRRAIWHRDGGRCQHCGRDDVPVQLDHVVPWSAGGRDEATNLRLLCEPCNTDRSNFRTFELVELLPVVAGCDRCEIRFAGRRNYDEINRLAHPEVEHHVAFCASCKRRSTVIDPRKLR